MFIEERKKGKSNNELMELYRDGEYEAFKELYGRFRNSMYNFLLRGVGGDRQEASDLFQRLFLKIHKARFYYDPKLNVNTWVYTIARNLLKDKWKSKGGKWASEEEKGEFVDTSPNAEKLLAKVEMNALIYEGLKSLPISQREVILLAKFEGKTHEEISMITGQSVGAVKQKMHRAYEKLRVFFKQIRLKEIAIE